MGKTYFNLGGGNFFQDWSDPTLLTANDDWSKVPSIVGYLGNGMVGSATGVNPATVTGDSTDVDVIVNQTNPNTNSTGGVAEFQIANPTVALQGSGTAGAPYLALYLDSTGRQNVTLSFLARDIDGSIDNATQPLAVQYRIGDSGPWITLPAGSISDASTGPSLATLATPVTVTLPPEANNQAQLQVRILTTNAGGSDEWIGIDDISVTSTAATGVAPGQLSILDSNIVEGNAGTTDMLFTVNRTGGSDGEVSATWNVSLGTATAADLGSPLSGTVTFAAGQTSATIRVPVLGDLSAEPVENFTVLLTAPTGGATIGDGSGLGTIVNDDVPPPANVFINEFNYDPDGTDSGEFLEIAGLAGTDLSNWSIVLYNGNGGTPYGSTLSLSGILADSANGFGFRTVNLPTNGLQNGSPDGIALVDPFGRVIQFLSYEGTIKAVGGPANGLTSTDIGVFQDDAPIGTSLQLVGTGSSAGDFTWVYDVTSTAGGANAGQSFLSGTDRGQIRIADAYVSEGNAGTTPISFTVTRAGGFATEASVAWSLDFGTSASADDLAPGATSGVLTFAPNEFTKTITLQVATDLVGENNEGFLVRLGDVTGNAIVVDDNALGVILNDDPFPRTIMEIQGEGHESAFTGQPVITSGIVTALDINGFYLQDPNGDGNAATSDGIFVFTNTAPTVKVGDALQLTGTVSEFKPGSAGLSITQVTASSITTLSSGNALPETVKIGVGGLLPPTEIIDNDSFAVFDPQQDGIDFWESLEGMRVTIDSPIAVSSTNGRGETDIVASGGTGATGINERGGITISAGDYNPEKIQLEDKLVPQPALTTGDLLGSVTGIVNYSFERYELLATEAAVITTDRTLGEDGTLLSGDANHLSIATYNLENLDPSDGKYDILAHDVVYSLRAPDIIGVQEVQDPDGDGTGAVLSGASNVQGLIDAIRDLSGLVYTYVEIAPTTANSTGGEPNGNIRNGYLYLADRVSLVEGSLGLIEDPAYAGSRKPLVATWSFNGQEVSTINVHFTSRLGSDPLWGDEQPPRDGGDSSRLEQAAAVGDYVFDILSKDSSKQFVLLGDWNGFYFEQAQTRLTEGGVFTNLATLLPEEERYSYLFDGNSQLIDNILVTGGLLPGARYDAVHINAEFTGERPTDHDPQLALLRIAITPHDVVIGGTGVAENAPAGTVVGTLTATDTAGDTLTYALVDDADGLFTVDAATGIVSTTAAIDFEATPNFTLKVKVTDSAGLSSENDVVVTVNDVNEAPTARADSIAVDEDATSDNLWSQLLSNDSDPDAADQLTITAVGTPTFGSLIFDPASQKLQYVADADAFDALAPGAKAVDSFTYTIADRNGLTSTATVTIDVTGIDDGIVLSGGNGIDRLDGTAGEDRLFGNNGDDRLFGLDGLDRLEGGNGNDQLFGGRGNDLLIGGQGDDTLEGGAGADRFVFGARGGNDVVTDFDIASDSLLFDTTGIRSTQAADWNGDGVTDLRINLTAGGSVTLLGLSSLDGVATGSTDAGVVKADLIHYAPSSDLWLVS